MRLFLLTSLTMFAFAANSVLNRLALAGGEIGPAAFGVIRVLSAAVVLLLVMQWRGQRPGRPNRLHLVSVLALVAYITGFSFAYVTLDAGVGALILFGGVQITMFGGALKRGETVSGAAWFGAILAFGGLVYLLAPSDFTPDPAGALLMGLAALGWGVYSLVGRKAALPIKATGENFILAFPLVLLVWFIVPEAIVLTPYGVLLAMISGMITSGLGYALWYSVLPRLDTALAAVAQLTVPVIAMAGGVLLLGEGVSMRFVLASGLVLGGVAVSVFGPKGR
ncbi:MAG: DMT family transporter [Rhodobacteraceae bacterium]|nr:DMT family transporter [Paracoccaceae bacterium]